jgi:predicted ATPase/DNA-binding CsgD family transcriptional regulator
VATRVDVSLWQEVRRRHASGEAIKSIARELGIARNTVRRALAAAEPPSRRPRRAVGSIIDGYEPRILEELTSDPDLTVSEIATRIGWTRSATVLKDRVRALRPVVAHRPAAAAVPSGLPADLTSFVGREAELEAVCAALRDSRLVTLTGPGGVGKTRIAARAAALLRASFSDGMRLVELAPLREPELLPHAVRDAIDLADRVAADDPMRDLVDHLRGQELLLVLDNCEHLREPAADLVAALLRAAPRLRVLATSRQGLGLPGEQVVVIRPLPVPGADPDGEESPGRPQPSAAVTLFRDRAEAVVPGFGVTDANRAEVVALCRHLDGIPLAIELAAARLRVLSVGDLLARLKDPVGVLADRARATDERHRTLDATIGWSYQLCTPAEQALWSRAAVFVGSFDLEAVVAVCADARLNAVEVLDHVAALVDKSVLLREEHDGHVRFRMLETIRQFGLAQLSPDTVDAVRTRHLRWYAELTGQLAGAWHGPDQLAWCSRMRRERADLRTAIECGVTGPGCRDTALRLLAVPWFLWAAPLTLTEHRHWLDRALDAAGPDSPSRLFALATTGLVAGLQGDHEVARGRLGEATGLLAGEADPMTRGYVRHVLGMATLFGGDLDEAEGLLRGAASTYSAAEVPGDIRGALAVHQGLLYVIRGELDAAVEVLEPARRECLRVGELWVHSYVLDTYGFVALARGDLAEAEARAAEALRNMAAFEDTIGLSLSLDLLAWTVAAAGRSERAAVLFGAAAALWRSFGHQLYGSADWQARRATYESQARADVGEPAFDMAYRHGMNLSRRDVLRYALDHIRPPRLPATTSVLTGRELEVARHVLAGLTNRDIADRLVVSPRTVEGHVGRILGKLGFTSRTQLAVWVERHDR